MNIDLSQDIITRDRSAQDLPCISNGTPKCAQEKKTGIELCHLAQKLPCRGRHSYFQNHFGFYLNMHELERLTKIE